MHHSPRLAKTNMFEQQLQMHPNTEDKPKESRAGWEAVHSFGNYGSSMIFGRALNLEDDSMVL